MKKYNVLIVDDEKPARVLLEMYTQKITELQLVEVCSNAMDAIRILKSQPIDLLFLDIQMDELTGLDLLRMLKKRPATILTTAYSEFALEGYDLDVIDYLVKPIEFDRFFKAASKAMNVVQLEKNTPSTLGESAMQYMFIKVNHQMIKVLFDDLLYLENYGDYIKVYTKNDMYLTLRTLTSFEESLSKHQFFRVHRSYLINLDQIDVIEDGRVKIKDTWITISRRSKDHFFNALKKRGLF